MTEHLPRVGGSWVGLPDQKDTEANHGDADPATGRDHLVKDDHRQHRLDGIAEGSRGHDVAVIGPTDCRHVGEREANEKENAEPNGPVMKGREKRLKEAQEGDGDFADLQHPALEHEIAGVGAHHHQQDHY